MRRSENEWLELATRYSFRGRMDQARFAGPVLASARGSLVRDVNGMEYLDFNSGQMCAALGHNHLQIVEAIHESCETIIHSSSNYFNVYEIELARRLGEILPPSLQKSTFLISGSDANEAAISMAKMYTGKFEIASPHASFHGLSDATRSLTFAGWRTGYGPLMPGTYAMLTPYRYRCPFCQKAPDCTLACLEASFELLDAQSVGSLAAVITEPLFSAGGVIPAPPVWLRALKRKCEERGMLLILDEAQTGLAKLGVMFAFEEAGVVPDILTISKHFGGGVSISAAVTSAGIEETVVERGYVVGHSHCNDPLGCAAGIASIGIIQEENLCEKAAKLGERFRDVLCGLAKEHEVIGDVRGKGLLQGIELVEDRETKRPAEAIGRAVLASCVRRGLLCSARRGGAVLRFVPPFTTSSAQLDRAGAILDESIREVVKDRARQF